MEPNVPNQKLEPGVFQGTPVSQPAKGVSTQRVIRTMKSDASEAIRNQEETTVSIAIAEEKKRARQQADALAIKQAEPEIVPPAPKPVGRFIIIIIVLVVIGALAGAYVFLTPMLKDIKLPSFSLPSFSRPTSTTIATTTIPAVSPLAPSLLTADSEMRFNISKKNRLQVFSEIDLEKSAPLAVGFIKNIYFEEDTAGVSTAVSANRLLMFTNVSTPEILTRSLEKPFMVGFIGVTDNAATPFTIIKVSETATGLAGMLEWESTLPSFFDAVFGTNMGKGTNNIVKFHDIVVAKKDTRSFTSASGETLLYAFANPTTIVIAGSQSALETLLPIAGSK